MLPWDPRIIIPISVVNNFIYGIFSDFLELLICERVASEGSPMPKAFNKWLEKLGSFLRKQSSVQ